MRCSLGRASPGDCRRVSLVYKAVGDDRFPAMLAAIPCSGDGGSLLAAVKNVEVKTVGAVTAVVLLERKRRRREESEAGSARRQSVGRQLEYCTGQTLACTHFQPVRARANLSPCLHVSRPGLARTLHQIRTP